MRTLRSMPVAVSAVVTILVSATSVVGGASPPELVAVVGADADRGGSAQVAPTTPPPAPDPATEAVQRTNAVRAQYGLPALTLHPLVTQAASAHSHDQAATSRMSHVGSDGSTMATRLSATGYRWRMVAENVAAGQDTAARATDAWLNSPGHRANILNPGLVHIGVAVAYSASGTPYWTMLLAAPR